MTQSPFYMRVCYNNSNYDGISMEGRGFDVETGIDRRRDMLEFVDKGP